MVRVVYCFVCAALICAFSFSDTAAQVAFGRKKLPVYYKESSNEGHLELEFSEKNYKTDQALKKYGSIVANVAVEANKESVGAEEVVIDYLNGVLAGEYEQLGRFYVPGVKSESTTAAAQDLRAELVDLAEVQFLSEWFYSSAKFVLARLTYDSKRPRVVGFGFQDTAKGFLKSDDWGPNEGPVLGLFRHILSELDEGRTADYDPRPFDHAIEVLPGIFGATINVDGQVYGPAGWIEPGPGRPGKSVTSFVEFVLGHAAVLDDTAFTSLWCRTARTQLKVRAENEPILQELRQAHATDSPIKHVMTMDFADSHAHYFVEKDEPATLRAIFLAEEGGRFCLSQGPDYPELYGFLISEPVKKAVRRLWAG